MSTTNNNFRLGDYKMIDDLTGMAIFASDAVYYETEHGTGYTHWKNYETYNPQTFRENPPEEEQPKILRPETTVFVFEPEYKPRIGDTDILAPGLTGEAAAAIFPHYHDGFGFKGSSMAIEVND